MFWVCSAISPSIIPIHLSKAFHRRSNTSSTLDLVSFSSTIRNHLITILKGLLTRPKAHTHLHRFLTPCLLLRT